RDTLPAPLGPGIVWTSRLGWRLLKDSLAFRQPLAAFALARWRSPKRRFPGLFPGRFRLARRLFPPRSAGFPGRFRALGAAGSDLRSPLGSLRCRLRCLGRALLGLAP